MDQLMIVANVAIVFGVIYKLFELCVGRKERMMLIDKLGELDTTDVEPMSHVFPVQNVFREDVVTNSDIREQ